MKKISLRGDRLRIERTKKGIKAKDIALRCGISPGYLSQLESGKRDQPPSELVKKLADELSVSPEWLLGEDSHPPPEQDQPRSIGPPLKIGSGTTRETLEYRTVSREWLEAEVASMIELLPTAPEGRGRLHLIRRMLEMLHELQERCLDMIAGRKREMPETDKNVKL